METIIVIVATYFKTVNGEMFSYYHINTNIKATTGKDKSYLSEI
jgi:hypothetical protein